MHLRASLSALGLCVVASFSVKACLIAGAVSPIIAGVLTQLLAVASLTAAVWSAGALVWAVLRWAVGGLASGQGDGPAPRDVAARSF